MSDTIFVALIALCGTVITAISGIITQVILNKKNREKRKSESEEERKKQAVEEALKEEAEKQFKLDIKRELNAIKERLDEHNNYASKITDMQQDIAVIKTEINNLERKGVA